MSPAARWSDGAKPSNATRAVMSRMARLSTRLVADAWHNAWALAQSSVAVAASPAPEDLPNEREGEAAWARAVGRAAAFDRQEPAWPRR